MSKHSVPALDVGRAPDAGVPRLLTEAQVLGLVPISRWIRGRMAARHPDSAA